QTTAVSRWFVIPMPATSLGSTSDFLNTSDIQLKTEVQISFASCSTQPGWSKNCSNSFCAVSTLTPFSSKRIALELVVPLSIARIYFPLLPYSSYIIHFYSFH